MSFDLHVIALLLFLTYLKVEAGSGTQVIATSS